MSQWSNIMKILQFISLTLIAVALGGCSEPAPECWDSSVKIYLKTSPKKVTKRML